jgi:hypothetical protein
MVMAADYPFLDIFWTMLVFFGWVIWFWMLMRVLSDVFRRHDMSGWAKVGWSVFVIALPYLGVLIYLGTNGHEMSRREVEASQAARAQFDDYVKSTGATAEIENAKRLLDNGTINQAEFDAIKTKAVA